MGRHEEIQYAAYFLWQQRGCPFGTPEVDWFRAENQLLERESAGKDESLLVTAAKKVGAALGTVAGAAETIVEITVFISQFVVIPSVNFRADVVPRMLDVTRTNRRPHSMEHTCTPPNV